MNLFYSAEVSDTDCPLGEEESKHAIRVLRLSAGDEIHVTDGKGSLYAGIISSTGNEICNVDILRKLPEQNRRFSKVHIAIAPPKNNSRFEWFLEKSCEIGIDTITPIICEHSERRKLQEDRL
ncbi:MAG TPA: RsmE family RNA methyltransferase, partial [Flavobacteriales bacterium]|nr:RsmE family RNA methyltransferase [Flavobacteriales bacterium]